MNENVENLENVGNEESTNDDALPITFDELLQDPEYQREFDKKVAKAIEKSKAKWQKDEEAKRTEAEALARMSEEEKHKHELSKVEAERSKAVAELNAYKLKEEALKIATEKELGVSLLNVLDYSKETAESVKSKIDDIDTSFKKAVEKRINEVMKQTTPKQFNNINSSNSKLSPQEKAVLDEKYKNNPYYKG